MRIRCAVEVLDCVIGKGTRNYARRLTDYGSAVEGTIAAEAVVAVEDGGAGW